MEQETKYWYLRNHVLFEQMTEAEINDLCIIMGFKRANKDEIIYFAHENIKRIYILKKGKIKIVNHDDAGGEVIIEILNEGDFFGEIPLSELGEDKTSEYAQVISDEVLMCSFTLENFEKVLAKNPALAIRYSKRIGDKLKTLESRYSDLVFKDVKTRVINFFKDFAKKEGKWEGQKVSIENFLTHQDIAKITGSTRQTVTTILNKLEAEGRIVFESRKLVVIPDITAL